MNCTIASLAYILHLHYDIVEDMIGHDGSRGVHIQEVFDILLECGFSCTPIEAIPILITRDGQQIEPYTDSVNRFSKYLERGAGLLYIAPPKRLAHMCVYANKGTWDPVTRNVMPGIPSYTQVLYLINQIKL